MSRSANDYFDEGAPLFQDETLQKCQPSDLAVASEPPPKLVPRPDALKWDLLALSCHPDPKVTDNPLDIPSSIGPEMTEPARDPDEPVVKNEAGLFRPGRPPASIQSKTNPVDLLETAALAVQQTQSSERIDSKNNSEDFVPQLSPEKRQELKVETKARSLSNATYIAAEDSLTNSPTLHKHMIHIDQKNSGLPAVRTNSPARDGIIVPDRRTSGPLPPCSELAELANIAAQARPEQDQRVPPPGHHQHQQTFGSTSQSPRLPYHPSYSSSTQTSPVSFATPSTTARSPASTIGDGSYYSTQFPSYTGNQPGHYADRRPSTATEGQHALAAKSLRSGSSSESYGNTSCSTDGTSTAQTTPIDSSAMESATRPILPPPPGMSVGGIFKCDFDGCSAQPFQTQYLLSSHRNVHSSSRPHYCPVPECPRSEGGKGFKRKNEMIRHGLVHNSPGYICPFCPDRDHRYPRPDNLQRHVRVHHVDKDKDDPALREVLGQRPDGAIQKQRRRRAQSSNTAPEPPSA